MSNSIDTEASVIEWARRAWRVENRQPEVEHGNRDAPKTPDFIKEIREYQYRKGYTYGIVESAYLVEKMHRNGHSRLMEAHNMLWRYVSKLTKWRRSTAIEHPLQTFGEPSFPDISNWHKIRREVFGRDNHQCTKCESTVDLQCHHVEHVKEGGIAELSNLTTLCKECHKQEHSKR